MKKLQILYVSLFFAVLAGLALFILISPDRAFSDQENRNLAQKPALNAETLFNGSFQDGLNDYLSDQFPLRDFWMQMNTRVQKVLGKKEIGGVYLGKDGYYFEKYTDEDFSRSRKNFEILLHAINDQSKKRQDPFTVLFVPSPATVLSDLLPANAEHYNEKEVRSILAADLPDCRLIDLTKAFSSSKEQLYFRTDHHWTNAGAFLAYQALMGTEALSQNEFDVRCVSDDFYGTLFSKSLDPDAVPDRIFAPQSLPEMTVVFEDGTQKNSVYDPEKLSVKDQYAYYFGGNQGIITIKTSVHNGKKLLIFKDSFANSLVPYLTAHYEEITLIDLRYYNEDLTPLLEKDCEVLFLYELTNFIQDKGIVNFALLS